MARTKDFDEDEVLQKAMNIFWHKGYNGTSMQDLVDGLGISRSSMYDTFGDKHTLFIRSLENYKKMATAEMKSIVDNAPTAKEAIRRMFEYTIAELVSDKQHKGCFLVNAGVEMAPHDAGISKMLCDNDRQLETYFNEAIKKGQASGEISNQQSSHALAQFILNNIKGIRVTAKSGADKKIFRDIVDVTMSALG
ncbi:TetR/AcrR family transcriptional regulator [Mucilaginibacter sp. BT774]|uniref:TetR/AcrR family transcriptional regulator n=1 Tax=Mucilaginibacter sp. BT774 TaxID=3062276 RepID=UPI00267681F7|nr:TetR/AcrR family transcriptional regulator [Mucilaginibacter sp. BT774]MDO3624715.1 TetR/AcrR family transcriptional regulator [Mucilaginibacter sp. BT774]